MTSGEGASGEPFERAWETLQAHWADDAAHRHFIAFCASAGALSEAAKRYRRVREADPARRDRAALQLEAVLGSALASLEHARPAQKPRLHPRWLLIGCGVGLTLLGYVLLAVLRRFAR